MNKFVKKNKKRQIMYREMLGNQIQFNRDIKLQGTMTAVEKQLNKADLKAYKQRNKSVYSFIPGINHSNFGAQSKHNTNKKSIDRQDNERENLKRMEMFGYNRWYNNSVKSRQSNNVLGQSTQAYGAEFRHKHNNSVSSIINNKYPAKLDSLPSPMKTFEITPNSDMLSENRKRVNHYQSPSIDYGQNTFDKRSDKIDIPTTSPFRRAGRQSLEQSSLDGIL